MFHKKNQKITTCICIFSLFSSNIYAMMPGDIIKKEEKIEIDKKEKVYEPTSDQILLKNITKSNDIKENQTQNKSKLISQDTKTPEILKKKTTNSNNKNNSSNKSTIKNACAITLACGIFGGVISYLILKNYRDQALAEKRENIMMTIIYFGGSAISMLLSMLFHAKGWY